MRFCLPLGAACLFGSFLIAQESAPKASALDVKTEKRKAVETQAEMVTPRQPAITGIFPMSGRPGQTVEFNVRGEFLDGANRIEFESGDVRGAVIEAGFTTARARVRVDASAEPGVRYFRLLSPRGATNLLVFRISRWRQWVEKDGDGSIEKATLVSVPSLTSGLLHADMSGMAAWGEEADLYRFHAHKGQRLRFTVFGVRNLGTRGGFPQLNADLSLTILRASGKQLIWDEGRFVWEPYLDYTFAEEGDYIAAITVTRGPTTVVIVYPKYEPAFYQLAIGPAPQIWSVFPAGAQRGREVELEMRADFVPANPALILQSHGLEGSIQKTREPAVYRVKIHASADASLGRHQIFIRDDSGTAPPVRFIVGELPEKMESEPNDSREQSELLSWPVTVNGRMDHRGDEDWYQVKVKAGQKLAFDVEAENCGGSVMDAKLTLTDSAGKVLKHADDGPRVGLSAARDPRFTFAFEKAGAYYLKIENVFHQFGPEQIYRLTVQEPKPDFTLGLPYTYLTRTDPRDRLSVPQGGKTEFSMSLTRIHDFEGAVQIEVRGLPKGVTAAPVTVAAKQSAAKVVLRAEPGAALTDSAIEIVGTAAIGGAKVTHTALMPEAARGSGPGFWDYRSSRLHLTVAPPTLFSLDILAETVFLVRGQGVDVPVKVDRIKGFDAPLKVRMENLPPGVSVERTEVLDQGKQIVVRLKADESAAKARLSDLIVIGEVQMGNRRYVESSPKTTLQLD